MWKWASLPNKSKYPMKQFLNISALICVLSVPFALSSQTRKAIPAGRYEALSGVKTSRSNKGSDQLDEAALKNEPANIVINEAIKHLPSNGKNFTYYSTGKLDPLWENLFTSKGITQADKIAESTRVIFSDDLKRDKNLLENLKSGRIVILKDRQLLKDVLASSNQYEVLAYQATEDAKHLFLLRIK